LQHLATGAGRAAARRRALFFEDEDEKEAGEEGTPRLGTCRQPVVLGDEDDGDAVPGNAAEQEAEGAAGDATGEAFDDFVMTPGWEAKLDAAERLHEALADAGGLGFRVWNTASGSSCRRDKGHMHFFGEGVGEGLCR
jgi:hypothetical protein